MTQQHYLCENCHKHLISPRSTQEAIAVMQETFVTPLPEGDKPAIVCNECYEQFMAWMKHNRPEELRK